MLLCKIGGCHDDSAFSNRIRPDASAHVHHAASRSATASTSADVQSAARRARSRMYAHTYVRIRGILGSYVIMVITPTIGSSALATHESTIHAAHTFCITPTLARPCRQNTLGWDRETRAWTRDLYGRSNRIRAIVSQGHGCKVCIYFVTLRRYRFLGVFARKLAPTSVDKRGSQLVESPFFEEVRCIK